MVSHTGEDISYNIVTTEGALTSVEEERILAACRRAKSLRESNVQLVFRSGRFVMADVSTHHSKVMGK